MGYFDDLNNPDWGEGTAADKAVLSSAIPYRDNIKNNMNLMGLVMLNAVSGSTPDYSWMANRPARLRTPEEEAKLKDPKIQAYLQRQQREAKARAAMEARKTRTIVRGAGNRKKVDYAANFNGMNFTDDEKKFITEAGFDPTNARSVQEFILSRNKNANLGARKGVGIADGYWGDESIKAFNALRSYGTFKPKAEPVVDKLEPVKPVNEVPVDAPDFGYRTSNTYEGDNFASKMKGMGIRSNADLINFMHNSGKAGWKGDAWQTQFRSDVDKALGGDYSDANIRKVFGTQGKWGRGFLGRGDFGDFQNALQTNAGVWNSGYERRLSEARMDAGRKQYAAKMAQQYTVPQLTKPTVPIKDFSVGYKGVNTLGDAGQGSMGENDWMKFAALSGYLPQDMKEEEVPQEDWMKFAAQTGYLLS